MDNVVKSELNRYVDFISAVDGVKRIYLFGSYAWGEPNEDSDIDLLVIMNEDTNRLESGIKFNKGLLDRKMPVDILVDWESTFESASERATLQREIKEKGVLLYG